MAVKIRLKRGGKKKQPIYRIVAIEHTNPRDGKEIEVIGQYNPRTEELAKKVNINEERFSYWLKVGAKPSKIVAKLFKEINGAIIEPEKSVEKKVTKSKSKTKKNDIEEKKE